MEEMAQEQNSWSPSLVSLEGIMRTPGSGEAGGTRQTSASRVLTSVPSGRAKMGESGRAAEYVHADGCSRARELPDARVEGCVHVVEEQKVIRHNLAPLLSPSPASVCLFGYVCLCL